VGELDERVALPALVGLDRTDRPGAHRGGQHRPLGEREQIARDLGIAQLAEDLDHAGGVLAEQDLGLLEHVGDAERAQPARQHRAHRAIRFAERDEKALAGVAVALGLERARRHARGDPDLGVVVARQPPQHRQHLERAELGQIAHRRDLHLGLEVVLQHDERRVARGRRADLGQRGQRRRGLGRIAEHERHQAVDRGHRAHPAERGDRGTAQLAGRGVADERSDRILERGEPEPAGRAQRSRGDRGVAIRQPAMHERQQPDVAETAAHRRDHTAAIRRGVGEPRRLEQRERGALGDLPLGAERAAGELAEQAARIEPRDSRRRLDRPCRERRHRLCRRRLAVLESRSQRADRRLGAPRVAHPG
jgi:hypothetical protein